MYRDMWITLGKLWGWHRLNTHKKEDMLKMLEELDKLGRIITNADEDITIRIGQSINSSFFIVRF